MTRPPDAPNQELTKRLKAFLEKPEDPDFATLAEALCSAGRARDAERACRLGLDRFPDDLAGRRVLGRALLLQGNLQDAQSHILAVLRETRQDAHAMLLMTEVLLQKSDPGRARTMLMHAAKILGAEHPEVGRLQGFLGEVTGEIRPLITRGGAQKPLGPLIGGKGAILNIEEDSLEELLAPERVLSGQSVSAGSTAKWAWIALGALVIAVFGFTGFRMSRTASRVEAAVKVARKSVTTGTLEDYQAAHKRLTAAIRQDSTNPDLRAWLAKIEARMALEYLVDAGRVPASIFGAQRVHRALDRDPPGWLRGLQARLGLAHRSTSWGREHLLEAKAIQQIMQGVAPRPGSDQVRSQTVALLDRGVRDHPQATGLRYVRGLAHLANGDPQKAQADLTAVLARVSAHVPAQLALANLHLEQGNVVEAQERFNRVLGVNPSSIRARLGLVLTRLVRGRELAQAARDLQDMGVGENTPRLVRGWYSLAQAWLHYGRGELPEANGVFKDTGRAVIPDPHWLSWFIRLGLLMGDVDRARHPLEAGLAALRSGDDPLVQTFRLEIQLMEGLAEEVGRRAVALGKTLPRDGVAARRLGILVARARLAQGDHAGAASAFAALEEAEPEEADRAFVKAYRILAVALAAREQASKPATRKPATRRLAVKKPTAKRLAVTKPAAEKPAAEKPAAKMPLTGDSAVGLDVLDKGAARPLVAYVRGRLAQDPAKAMAYLQEARRFHRDAAPAGVLLAARQIAAGEVAKGQRTLNAAFALAPAYYPALRTRAQLRHSLGMGSEAMEDLTTLCYAGVRTELPRGLLSRLRYTAGWGARLARLDRRTLCPSTLAQPSDLYLRAELYLEQDLPGVADLARLYTALGRSAGGDPFTADVLKARVLLLGGATPAQAKKALESLDELAKIHGERAERSGAYHAALGAAHQAAGDPKAAATALRRATALVPSQVAWLTSLGWVELARREQAQAVAAFRRAVEEAVRQEADAARVRAKLQFALGRALMAAGKSQDLVQAQAALEEASRLDPQLFQATVELARVALLQKKPEEARKHLDEILRYDEGHPEALLVYIQLLKGGSKEDRARISALTDRLVKSARYDIQQGNLADGRYWLEEILEKVKKDHSGASLALAELLARTQTGKARARVLLQRVVKSGSDQERKQAETLLGSL